MRQRGARGADVRPHGSTAAARRHYRHREPLCRSCKQAEQRAWQDRRRKRKDET
jgi:hypothetical protein